MTAEMELIIEDVAEKYDVSYGEIIGYVRPRHVVVARDEAAWRMRAMAASFRHIGRVLRKDHTSVVVMIERHSQRMGR